MRIAVASPDADLRADIAASSLIAAAVRDGTASDADLVAAALSDYRALTEALYANGYYGGVISIRVDGQEVGTLNVLRPPQGIRRVDITVQPGRPFAFGRFTIAPTPPDTTDIPPIVVGERARSTTVRKAVAGHVDGWRDAGNAKATITSERYVADHARATLSGDVRIDPGPKVRFGRLILRGQSAVRERRLRKIAGLPEGALFSPEKLEEVARRLRRTGTFSSVSLAEAEVLGPGDTMDIILTTVDEKPRRFGIGAELSNFEGLRLSGFWLHRNLFGGAERLRIEAEADNIGGQTSGTDYRLSARITRPATRRSDTDAFALAEIQRLDEPTFQTDTINLGIGLERVFSTRLEGAASLTFLYADTVDAQGARSFRLLNLPVKLTWDRRNDQLNPTDGFYITAEVMPYLGIGGTQSGIRSFVDARGYQRFGAEDRFVFAARAQFGSVIGSDLLATYPDYLFYSGGGGTVRGQPYQSLDVDLGGGKSTGGRSFAGLSAELRMAVTDTIGVVAFADAGYIASGSFSDGSGAWHSGAGVGLRYATPFGPIRFDVAAPVGGDTGDGIQFYLGIGQAF